MAWRQTLQRWGFRPQSLEEALRIAAANGWFAEVKELLAEGADLNDRSGGRAPLHAAVGRRLLRATAFLIDAGADLNLTDDLDMTPLMSACSLGMVKGSRIALLLIEAGADVRYVRRADEMTALKFAAGSCPGGVIQALIDRGAEVDGPPGTDQTALMLAARANNVEALKVLVRNGADVSLPCKLPWANDRTAEGLAELEGRPEARAYLRRLRARRPGRSRCCT